MAERSTGPVRTALIGYGLAGSVFHAPLIAALPEMSLEMIVTSNPERQAQAAAAHPGAKVVASAAPVWEQARDLDLAVIATTNKTHVPLAGEALDAGLAVVVDKPLSATAAEGASLAAKASKLGLMLSVFQNRRWDGDFLTLRQLLERGELGQIWRFESRFERWRPDPGTGWRESGDPAEVGGLLYDLGSHLVDQALVLFGPVRSVYAEMVARRAGAKADDDTFVALEHDNGALSHLWMSATAAQVGPRFKVLGSQAGFVKFGLDPQEAALREGGRPGHGWGEEPEEAWGWLGVGGPMGAGAGRTVRTLPGAYHTYYKAVAEAVRRGGPPPVSGAEAVAGLGVLEAAKASAQERRTIVMPVGS